MEVACGVMKHSGSGFAAGARAGELGMMGAEIEGVYVSAVVRQEPLEVDVEVVEIRLAVVSTGDASLVGHYDDKEASGVEARDSLWGTGDKVEIVRTVKIVDLDIDRAVTVEKDGSAASDQRFVHE